MTDSKLEKFREFVENDPNDPFSWYGLAMEYDKAGMHEQSITSYKKVTEVDPNYSAAYYHAAVVLGKVGRSEEAKQMIQKGIEVTTKSGDEHTKNELIGLLDTIG